MTAESYGHGHNQSFSATGTVSDIRKRDRRDRMMTELRHKKNTRNVVHFEWWSLNSPTPAESCPCQRNPRPPFQALLYLILSALLLFATPSTAAFVPFTNCLDPNIVNSNNPTELQFVPLFAWASFNSSAVSHNINVTVFGNISGIATIQPYPNPADQQYWKNPNETVGKIPDIAGPTNQQKYTTFTTQFNVLDYTPYNPPATRFCNSSALTQCPLAPLFNTTVDE